MFRLNKHTTLYFSSPTLHILPTKPDVVIDPIPFILLCLAQSCLTCFLVLSGCLKNFSLFLCFGVTTFAFLWILCYYAFNFKGKTYRKFYINSPPTMLVCFHSSFI
ncbi:hypothetical protein AAHE18_18G192100 [Arachis hypogaea]